MPKVRDLRSNDEDDAASNRAEIESRLRVVLEEQELYRHPAWSFFRDRMKAEEDRSLDALVAGDDPGARERVKVVRHLALVPDRLEEERARLTAELSAPEVEE